jgi:serine/threonine-protein kinase
MTAIRSMKFTHLIGQEVGTATLIKELARGGMAVIFVAYQKTLKRQIAIKILPKSILTPVTAELFQQEAESAAILSHPNVIQIFEVGETPEFLYFTMQLVQGQPISEFMKMARRQVLPSRRFLPLSLTLETILQVLKGLDYAHQQNVIHRDIKPSNILIESHTKRAIITDFGLSYIRQQGSDDNLIVVKGTPLYMAPEQMYTRKIDHRIDIYAVGVMLFEMLVQKLPLPPYATVEELAAMKLGLRDKLFQKKPSEMNPKLHKDMDNIVEKAVCADPEKRYANCRELMSDLLAYRNRYLAKEKEG